MSLIPSAWLMSQRLDAYEQGAEIEQLEAQYKANVFANKAIGLVRGGYCLSAAMYWIKRHSKTVSRQDYRDASEKTQLRVVHAKLWEKGEKVRALYAEVKVANNQRLNEHSKVEYEERINRINGIKFKAELNEAKDTLHEGHPDVKDWIKRGKEIQQKQAELTERENEIGANDSVVGEVRVQAETMQMADKYKLKFVDGWKGDCKAGKVGIDIRGRMQDGRYYLWSLQDEKGGHALALYLKKSTRLQMFDPNMGAFSVPGRWHHAKLLNHLFAAYQDGGVERFKTWQLLHVTTA